MFFSFIIPVYNVASYLHKCIDSILDQKFTDYEIILIDDGSTDDSPIICDQYAEKDKRITAIHKSNGGLSDARNTGLKIAVGKFVIFIDSDDFIGENTLSVIYNYLKNNSSVDVLFLNMMKIYPNGKIISIGEKFDSNKINGKDKDQVMFFLSSMPKYPGSACGKVINKSLIDQFNLYFEKKLLSEDIDWTCKLYKIASSFSYLNINFYYYRQNRKDSISNSWSLKNFNDLFSIIEKWSSKELIRKYQVEFNSFMSFEYVVLLLIYTKLSKEDKNITKTKLLNLKWLLTYGKSFYVRLIYLCSKIIGITNTGRLLNIFLS